MIDAKKYLEEIERDNTTIENKLAEINQLENLATNISATTSVTPVQSSGTSDRIGKIVADIADKENELQKLCDEFVDKINERIKLIEQLNDRLHYIILHKHYVQFKPFKLIAKEVNYTYDYVIKKHTSALIEIEKILNNTN